MAGLPAVLLVHPGSAGGVGGVTVTVGTMTCAAGSTVRDFLGRLSQSFFLLGGAGDGGCALGVMIWWSFYLWIFGLTFQE